jgi:hypothetical protein
MVRGGDCSMHEARASAEAKGVEKLKKKWWQRKV